MTTRDMTTVAVAVAVGEVGTATTIPSLALKEAEQVRWLAGTQNIVPVAAITAMALACFCVG